MRELFNWRWQYILYPFWRRTMPKALRPITDAILDQMFPTYIDKYPVREPAHIARYWVDENIMAGDVAELTQAIESANPIIETVALDAEPALYEGAPVRPVAQWEPMQSVLMRFGTFYPPAWAMHAQMIEAISAVARVEIMVDSPLWAHAIHAYLQRRFRANFANIIYLHVPTNDVWIRDYGAIMAHAPDGTRVAVNPTYAVLPQYPQADDNAMPERWSAHRGIPVLPMHLHTEGGNLWADGTGTLIMTSQIFYSNRYYERDTLEAYLHTIFDFEKLIITPRMTLEETGHVDLLAKLASADTILLSQANTSTSAETLRKIKRQFERETNAQGTPYRVLELPTPSLYINWGIHTIRRAYTNALTVNGRVLVPVYGVREDEQALRVYETAMPDHDIIPIDSSEGINGGGAVHCMTREIPV
jgi:agmatine deiminase